VTNDGKGKGPSASADELFGILADQSPNMIFVNNLQHNVFVNTRCAELTGYSREELNAPGFDFRNLIAPEDRVMVEERLGAHREGQEVAPYAYRLVTKDGRRVDVINSTRLITYRGQPAILGVVTDITEFKQAQRALAESEARYRALIELLPDAVAVTDLEGKLQMANQQLARLHGFDSPEELIATTPSTIELVAPERLEQEQARARRLLEGGGVEVSETTLLRRDGSQVIVETALAVMTGEDGKPAGFVGVLRDITVRKQAEELQRRVLQAQKLESLGILAGGIAHDFNNLLMGMLGSASLALEEVQPSSPLHGHIEQISSSATRAAELTRELLAYSGKGRVAVRPLVLSELVQGMGELLRISLPKKAMLDYRLEEQPPVVEGDAAQLQQVVMNLIINAGESLGDSVGSVTVRVARETVDRAQLARAAVGQDLPEGTYALLEVTDTGSGMDAATQARMFDPFYTTKTTGRGLGLAAVLGIVRGHGGALQVESRPKEGTAVRVLLPLAAATVDAPSPPQPERFRGWGTILVVDDESVVRVVATSMLEKLGFEVIAVSGGAAAVDVLQTKGARIRAVVLDLTMPELSGEETLRILREINPDLPVLLSSGYDQQEAASHLGRAGRTGFVQKPYRLDQLARALEDTLS
jgi:two-component system cell cycle sensor histidine kinase/response regulator CckA